MLPRSLATDRLIDTEYSRYYTSGSPYGLRAVRATITNVLDDSLVVERCGAWSPNVVQLVSDGERWRRVDGGLACAMGSADERLVLAPRAQIHADVALPSSAAGTYALALAAAWRCTARPAATPGACDRSSADSIPLALRVSRSFTIW